MPVNYRNWVKVRFLQTGCRLTRDTTNYYRIVHQIYTVRSTYLIHRQELHLAVHLTTPIITPCTCPPIYEGVRISEIRTTRLSLSLHTVPTAPPTTSAPEN